LRSISVVVGDGNVFDPELLELELHRLAVDADLRRVAARPDQRRAHVEGLRDPDRLNGDVDTESSVMARTLSRQSFAPLLTLSVAPKVLASFRRFSSRSTAMIRDGPYRPAVMMIERPTGPAPTTATTVGHVDR
jgi:hypothetical protein